MLSSIILKKFAYKFMNSTSMPLIISLLEVNRILNFNVYSLISQEIIPRFYLGAQYLALLRFCADV